MEFMRKLHEKLVKRGVKTESEWTCKLNASMQSMIDLVARGNLLNQKQCEDLTTKLAEINDNVYLLYGTNRSLASQSCMKNLYRCMEKARMLVTACGEREWWRAAAVQWRNENAFQEILLDASLCYNVIQGNSGDNIQRTMNFSFLSRHKIEKMIPDHHAHDFRQSLVFQPASTSDVQKDREDLYSLLVKLVYDPESIQSVHCPYLEDLIIAQSLAKYLLLKNGSLEESIGIMWENHREYPGTWGNASYLGGTGASDVVTISTTWLGIQCVKKEFYANGEGQEKMFLKEAMIMTHLRHPCIIHFLCCGNGQDHGCRFIAMELMDKSLFRLIEDRKGKPFMLEVILDIFMQIARGMCYLHDQGVAHRDLKPHNVVVNELASPHLQGYYNVKLIDFGTSKADVEVTRSSTITYFGIGTTMYRAPELHPKAKVDSKGKAKWFKADVFSFAMTCVHVLSLQEPFKGMKYLNTDQLYNEVMNGLRPELPKDCPQMLRELLRDCWNTVPSRRPAFVDICSRLEITSYEKLACKSIKDNQGFLPSIDFIKSRMEAQSLIYMESPKVVKFPKVVHDETNDEDENKSSNFTTIRSCNCNFELIRFQKSPYLKGALCNICGKKVKNGDLYHCPTCQFTAHPRCAQLEEKVFVFFHDHSLQLLTQNYYNNNPEAICSLCEGSLQYSEWVYRCEKCEYEVHEMCTRLPNYIRWDSHKHSLIMRTCPPRKSLVCARCNGGIPERSWNYFCGPCGFSMHLLCAIFRTNLFCPFDDSHVLKLDINSRTLNCTLCGIQGNSQLYHCDDCDVHIHLRCVNYIDVDTCNWNEAYEKVMMEKDNKDVHTQTLLISDLLDKLPFIHAPQARSTTQRPLSVMRVQALIQNPIALKQREDCLETSKDDRCHRNMVSTSALQRIKAKKMTSIKSEENFLKMLENVENILVNLQSYEDASKDEKEFLIVTHEKLKKRQQLEKEGIAIQEESRICPGPRIGVFFRKVVKDGCWIRELLFDVQSSMKDVHFALLCEEQGHEHIVEGKTMKFLGDFLGEELTKNL